MSTYVYGCHDFLAEFCKVFLMLSLDVNLITESAVLNLFTFEFCSKMTVNRGRTLYTSFLMDSKSDVYQDCAIALTEGKFFGRVLTYVKVTMFTSRGRNITTIERCDGAVCLWKFHTLISHMLFLSIHASSRYADLAYKSEIAFRVLCVF